MLLTYFFVTTDSNRPYDSQGTKVKSIPSLSDSSSPKKKRAGNALIVAIDWYDGMEGYADSTAPTLAVAYADGRVQLARGSDDADPIIIDSGLRLRECKWDTRGTTLSLAGTSRRKGRRSAVLLPERCEITLIKSARWWY